MKPIFFLVFILSFALSAGQSFAKEIIVFGPDEAKIDGSISYTVLGKYKAKFNDFTGRVVLDDNLRTIQSVYLEIDVKSIHSNSAWCDRAVRSRRLLNARKYPDIIFKSDKIIHDENGYQVKGVLEMHGIKRRMMFPFRVEMIDGPNVRILSLKGFWVINRKDFNIIWSKTLDHGGILVGDDFTVNWEIKSPLLKRNK